MTRGRRRGVALAGLLLLAGVVRARPVALAAQSPVFRSRADVVIVDVAVRTGNRPVASLTKDDFELRDNNVVQTIASVTYGALPIDVRLLVDLSGSVNNDQLARYQAAMRQVEAALTADDRCEISTFARRIRQTVALRTPPMAASLQRLELDGTSFNDAAILSMITVAHPGRRQLTMLLTDGIDTYSFFDLPTLIDAAKRTDAVVYAVSAVDSRRVSLSQDQLKRLATTTGGQLLTIGLGADIGPALTQAIAEFRQTYVLDYTPAGVPREGWHTIVVTVPKAKAYTIRARQGYFGG